MTSSRRAFLHDLVRLGGGVAGLGLLAGCAPAPAPAAPPPARVYRVGLLTPSAGPSPPDYPELWERLRELGYVEGQNLARETRGAAFVDGLAPFAELAAELALLPVDVIVAANPPAARAAARATDSIPIVMMLAGGTTDPVVGGLVESLARPGRNVTGIAGSGGEVDLKRLQLLTEAVPGVAKVAVLGNAPNPSEGGPWASAARSLGVDFIGLPDPSSVGYEEAFAPARAQGADALLIRAGFGVVLTNQELIASLAQRYRLPGISPNRGYATGGGLMAYEARASEVQRRAADYVDRILRGGHPAEMPVELPTRYDLIVNLRAARELGLNLSRDFLSGIDEAIE